MKHIKEFEEYVKLGIAKKQNPDLIRAKALVEESKEGYDILMSYVNEKKINDYNANHIIKNAYDVLMELIRAKMLSVGFNSSGHGAHEAEVSFLKNIGMNETDIEFADQLRYFRNSIIYYGKKLNVEYAKKVLKFVKKMQGLLK